MLGITYTTMKVACCRGKKGKERGKKHCAFHFQKRKREREREKTDKEERARIKLSFADGAIKLHTQTGGEEGKVVSPPLLLNNSRGERERNSLSHFC